MKRSPTTADDRARILFEWAKGRTYPEIAADLGFAENAIENVIRRSSGPIAEKAKSDHVINMTARKSAFYTGKYKDAERNKQVLAKWAYGLSGGEISKELNMTTNAVIGIVHRSKDDTARQSHNSIIASRAKNNGAKTKLAKSERQRDETAQAMVERRRAGTLLRQPPQLELVSSVELPRKPIEPPFDPYAHLRTDGGLRKALAAMTIVRDIGTGIS